MPLTEFQKAFLKNILIPKTSVIDPDTGEPVDWDNLGGGLSEAEVQALIDASGSPDPIEEHFGAPTTAFEFDSSSLTGLTAIGAPTTLDADTTVPDHLYIATASQTALLGLYAALPAAPFTAIAKLSDAWLRKVDGWTVGTLFAGNPGLVQWEVLRVRSLSGAFHPYHFFWNGTPHENTNVLGEASDIEPTMPFFFAIRANSATNVDFLLSQNGRVWRRVTAARNPGYTLSQVGVGLALGGTVGYAAYDFLRIWDSAKTFTIMP